MDKAALARPVYVDAHAHLDEYPGTWLGAVLQQLEDERIASISTAMAPARTNVHWRFKDARRGYLPRSVSTRGMLTTS